MMLAIPTVSAFDERLSDSTHCLHISGTGAFWHAREISLSPASAGSKKRGDERVRRNSRSFSEVMEVRFKCGCSCLAFSYHTHIYGSPGIDLYAQVFLLYQYIRIYSLL